MTEFALVFPILLILLVAVADFGRVFAAGVVVEAAARNAAEAAALEYARNPPGDPTVDADVRLSAPAPDPGSVAYYDDLHAKAARVACADMRSLPNTTFNDADGTCPTWPVVRVCVHDGVNNNNCGAAPTGFASSVPADCPELLEPWTSAQVDADGDDVSPRRWVEVRVCYPFTTLLDAPLVLLPDVFLQRTRTFSVPCFLDPATSSC